jgi:hypothetical protein
MAWCSSGNTIHQSESSAVSVSQPQVRDEQATASAVDGIAFWVRLFHHHVQLPGEVQPRLRDAGVSAEE